MVSTRDTSFKQLDIGQCLFNHGAGIEALVTGSVTKR